MRIVFVEWFPRICGPVEWAAHVASGFVALGHEVDSISFSPSGKRLAGWGNAGRRWTPRKSSNAVDVLAGYDLVVLSDIACRYRPIHDVAPRGCEESDVHWYADVLDEAGTPWTAMVHDGAYAKRLDPTIDALVRTSSFSGVLVTTRLREAASRIESIFPPLISPYICWIDYPYLPYDPGVTEAKVRDEDHGRRVIMTSRITANKGQDAVVELFRDLDCDVDLWGHNSFGLQASPAWHLWELGLALGYDAVEYPRLRDDKSHYENRDTVKFFTGPFALGYRGRVLRYRGDFVSQGNVDWRSARASLSLTSDSLRGTLEYATLDAVYNGLTVIVPDHAVEYASYETVLTVSYRRARFKAGDDFAAASSRAKWSREDVLSTVTAAVDSDYRSMAATQREEIDRLHDPRVVASMILEAAS